MTVHTYMNYSLLAKVRVKVELLLVISVVLVLHLSAEGLSELFVHPLVLHREHTQAQSLHVCGFHTETR